MSGVVETPTDGCAELGGIGTLPAYRNRGIAAALTGARLDLAFGFGAEPAFLTPGGPQAQHLYERAGFRSAGMFLHLRR